ncbi:ArsB/NhaD family transporter [Nannocystis sp. ILAH1]|uniref:sodium:proton antiporter n=1 Tax=unclassified Nannocystis TaxID=2627009 RepID=UPI0022704172|nr:MULTISPECIES: ArsB/NhaD family transporter [unclassified Nannocystis]MCY0988589.1 ArsB/NhaD family transporter [Nannocystis sp. ILAH1]
MPEHVIFGLDPLWLATALLVLTYAAIMSEKINRAVVALLGAGLMISLGVLTQEQAIHGVDFNTIALLTGMMILVNITRKSGIFQFIAFWSARKAGGVPWKLLIMLTLVTAVLSALLDNVTTVLLITPVTLLVARELDVPAYPFLFAEIFASNIGGTATLIGDPPNILIGSAASLSFNDFVRNLAPVVGVLIALQVLALHAIWGKKLRANPEAQRKIMALEPAESIKDHGLLVSSLGVLFAVLAGFVTSRQTGIEPGTVAMFGAAVLMFLYIRKHPGHDQSHRVQDIFGEVEWVTIFFFVGLFMVVAGVEHAGLLDHLAHGLVDVTGGDRNVTAVVILWASAVLSAIIDNIPFVATMIPLIKSMTPAMGGTEGVLPLWWALSLGACLGGNGTLVGASANLTVAGLAEREGVQFKFLTYTKLAFPLMLGSIAVAHAYLYFWFLD